MDAFVRIALAVVVGVVVAFDFAAVDTLDQAVKLVSLMELDTFVAFVVVVESGAVIVSVVVVDVVVVEGMESQLEAFVERLGVLVVPQLVVA